MLVGVVQDRPGGVEDHRLHGLDRAEQDHAQVGEQLLVRQARMGVRVQHGRERRSVGGAAEAIDAFHQKALQSCAGVASAGQGLGVLVADEAVREVVVDVVDLVDVLEAESEDVAGHRHRERVREGAGQLRLAVALDARQQALDVVGDQPGELRADRAELERGGERRAVAVVLGAVDDQHHVAQDDALRVGGHVHHEAVGRVVDLVDQRLGRHQPDALLGEPRHRLGVAQPGQQRTVVEALEIGQSQRGAQREALGELPGVQRGHRGPPITASTARGRGASRRAPRTARPSRSRSSPARRCRSRRSGRSSGARRS